VSNFLGYRDGSRTNWGTTEDSAALSLEQINCGALLRIADATELMARRHAELIEERDRYKRYHDQERERKLELARSNIALRGQITKLRKKLACSTGQKGSE
jgi:hypothetical protein